MLRQLARLGHAVPGLGPRALALGVYARHDDELVPAREAGVEGIACVDDAARALELYCDLWAATALPWTHRWCLGLLDFVLAMQDGDGRWINFILDWDGAANRTGRTSLPGGGFWQARALQALVHAIPILDDSRITPAVERGLPHAFADHVPPDVRVLHMMTACALLRQGADAAPLLASLLTWSEELVDCKVDGVLMNSPFEVGTPHLWGHVQEGVLADVGALLGRDELIATALTSADKLYPAIVGSNFDVPLTQPYGVACAAYSLTRIAAISGDAHYGTLAAKALRWFDGENPARKPVYDRVAGRVGDGIDHGVVNASSGAESNIVAAQALFGDATELARSLTTSAALPEAIH